MTNGIILKTEFRRTDGLTMEERDITFHRRQGQDIEKYGMKIPEKASIISLIRTEQFVNRMTDGFLSNLTVRLIGII